jgi:hypothetical protein
MQENRYVFNISFHSAAAVGSSAVPVVSSGCKLSFTITCFFSFLKTVISMLFIACLVVFCSTSAVEAANTTFRVDSGYGVKKGSTVIIDVSIENSQELFGCSFEMEYDADIVVATHVARGGLLADYDFDWNLKNADEGKIFVFWENEPDDYLVGDGRLFRIYFTVEAEGSTSLSVRNLSLLDSGRYTPSIINGYISSSGTSGSLEIVTGSYLTRANRNSYYSISLEASGGTAPYRWSRLSGSLPPGLRLSSSGVISGTPTSMGSYTFTVRVTDDRNARQEKEFSLNVTKTGHLSADEALFNSLLITQSTMKLNLIPDNMPYTMVVDNDTNRVSLTVNLDDTLDYLRINGTSASNGAARIVALGTGMNQVTIAVSPDGYLYRNYILTIYRLP